jgi:cation transporter-like permease
MEQIPSSAAQVIIALIPIVGIVMGAVVVFFYLLWNHRRRTLLIQAGHYGRPEFDLLSFSLLAGLLLGSVGLALTVFLAVVSGRSYGLLGGIIPLSMGVGLLVYYSIKRGTKAQ